LHLSWWRCRCLSWMDFLQ